MIGHLDTSALVPLVVAEPSSAACGRFWDDADDVVTCRIADVEAAAALAQALRMGRLDSDQHAAARDGLATIWRELDVIDIDQDLVNAAADAAPLHALCGCDAVHCAAAGRLADPDLVVAAGDRTLLAAWRAEGHATFDVTAAEDVRGAATPDARVPHRRGPRPARQPPRTPRP